MHAGPQRFQDRPAGEVLRGDQLQTARLPFLLFLDDLKYLRVIGRERLHHHLVMSVPGLLVLMTTVDVSHCRIFPYGVQKLVMGLYK
uniref:Uncharacterized protein n=1 Tax=Anguilla anguilla TaxID=7936 RepID=A0A0E9TS19_ANGAN